MTHHPGWQEAFHWSAGLCERTFFRRIQPAPARAMLTLGSYFLAPPVEYLSRLRRAKRIQNAQ